MWIEAAASGYNAYGDGRPWDLNHFRATGGYVNPSFDALWLRAPYLHNGSAPYLTDLSQLPQHRRNGFTTAITYMTPNEWALCPKA